MCGLVFTIEDPSLFCVCISPNMFVVAFLRSAEATVTRSQTMNLLFLADFEVTIGFLTCRSCLLYTSPSPRDIRTSRMPSSA